VAATAMAAKWFNLQDVYAIAVHLFVKQLHDHAAALFWRTA